MCSCTAHVFLAHLLGLGLGMMFIADLARRGTPDRLFWVATAGVSFLVAAFVFHVSEPLARFDDFTTVYWVGGDAALEGADAVAALFGNGVTGFVNIPVLAYAFAPFALLPPFPAALLFTALGVLATLLAWRLLADAAALDRTAKALLLFLFASFGPLLYSVREGNTSHFILALLAWSILLLRTRRDFIAGAVLGIAALIKLPLLLLGVYLALRGRWHAVAGGAAVIGIVCLASLAIFGWQTHVVWYETTIAPFARHPIPALNVQSIASAVARIAYGPSSVLDWSPHELAPAFRFIASASTILLVALAVASALAPRPARARATTRETAFETELLIVLLLACTISTLSWSHYYAWMLVPVAFFVGRTPHFAGTPAVRVLGWIAIALAAAPMAHLTFGNAYLEDLNARFGTSRLLAGGLLMLGLLIWSRWQSR
jgi:alpha-1,2-mannosyltransferase